MSINRLSRHLASGQRAFGGWCLTPSPFMAETLAEARFDYVCVDCQHGLIHYEAMWPMLLAIQRTPVTPVVRVPFNDTPWIGKALDAGAECIIVPMVNSVEDAKRAVSACRYSPEGVRSFGPVRSAMFLGADPPTVNSEVLCFVMIETATALDNVDDICATEGVDGVYIGPADLAISMGVSLEDVGASRAHADAITQILQSCRTHGVIAGIHTTGGEQANRYANEGFQLCTLATDISFVRDMATKELAISRGSELAISRGSIDSEGTGGIYT